MEITRRQALMNLIWIGLLLAGQISAQEATRAAPGNLPPSAAASPLAAPRAGQAEGPFPPGSIVGEQEPGLDAVFGNRLPNGCEFCGGGQCTPPTWSVENDVRVLTRSRPLRRQTITGQYTIASQWTLINPGETVLALQEYRFDTQRQLVAIPIATHTLNFDLAPEWSITLSRYLGRDGNDRDHFLEFGYWGLGRWSSSREATGTLVPFRPTEFQSGQFLATHPGYLPAIDEFRGSLISPFPWVELQDYENGTFTLRDLALSDAFNGVERVSATYSSTANSFELNTHVEAHNRPDRLVLNPNGRWYRQCQSGLFYSYLFGLRTIIMNEKFELLSSGQHYNAVTDPVSGNVVPVPDLATHGRYVVRTENYLLGLQAGGNVEYRFCKWAFDVHGKVGPFVNIAKQRSHIQTREAALAAGVFVPPPQDIRREDNRNVASVFGEFGVGATHKFNPNWIGHVSYDFLWVGNIALAPDQLQFTGNPAPSIDTSGALFFHGLTLGLEYNW